MMRSIRSDRGFALMAVMGAIVIITLVAMTGFVLSREALGTAQREGYENRAYQSASTGLDRVWAIVKPDQDVNGAPWEGTLTNGDTYSVTLKSDPGSYLGQGYVLTAVGRSGDASETLVLKLFSFNLWEMNASAGTAGGMSSTSGWNGNAYIKGAFYTKGDMDWSNGNGKFDGPGPLFIKDGALLCGGSATVGENQPVYLYATEGIGPGSKMGNIYLANNPPGTSVPDLPLQWITDEKMEEMGEKAKEQSCNNTMDFSRYPDSPPVNTEASTPGSPSFPGTVAYGGSTYYKYLVPAGGSLTGTHNLSIGGSSFGRWPGNGYANGSNEYDDFAYDVATRTLYVNGVVIVDGDLAISNVSQYVGNGVIWANGDVDINTDLMPQGGSLSEERCLGISSVGDVHLDSTMNGAIFCNGKFWLEGTQAHFKGTCLAGSIDADHPNCSLIVDPLLKDVVPKDMPQGEARFKLAGNLSRR